MGRSGSTSEGDKGGTRGGGWNETSRSPGKLTAKGLKKKALGNLSSAESSGEKESCTGRSPVSMMGEKSVGQVASSLRKLAGSQKSA